MKWSTAWAFFAVLMPLVSSGQTTGVSCAAAQTSTPAVVIMRTPAVAGTFYPGEPRALRTTVVDLLTAAAPTNAPAGRLLAAIVPHAGYRFSGPTAAAVFNRVPTSGVARVLILAPSHRMAFHGVALPDLALGAYRTPLGDVPVDRVACTALSASGPVFVQLTGADVREHAIEVELPFLQVALESFQLVPLICGTLTDAEVTVCGAAVARLLDDRTLVVASSDFTHYGPNYAFTPFRDDIPRQLDVWLEEACAPLAALDRPGFERHLQSTSDTICGQAPIRILLAALEAAGRPLTGQILATATSGDITGGFENSVSYAAIGYFSTNSPALTPAMEVRMKIQEHRNGTWTPGLTPAEQATLFAIAHDTLVWCTQPHTNAFPFDAYELTPAMLTNTATFVTLKVSGNLRGCIGSLEPHEPLYLSVHHNAVQAALQDPRFQAVRASEVSRIHLAVSVLSPIRAIASLEDFTPGRHGIILTKGRSRAVYLPEVATEQGWTRDETLSSLSEKAGLPPDAWRAGAHFQLFESVVLSQVAP
ncbi:MAG: AmmeMemoRadiSam system protein B [Kiritimatiellia bacterium]